jgi:hypothetical protein
VKEIQAIRYAPAPPGCAVIVFNDGTTRVVPSEEAREEFMRQDAARRARLRRAGPALEKLLDNLITR